MNVAHDHRAVVPGDAAPQDGAQSDVYDAATIRQLNALTSDFYAREAASFSATRQAPWHGWEKAWECIAACNSAPGRRASSGDTSGTSSASSTSGGDTSGAPLSVLDLGCGNLRFERFLAERTSAPIRVTALDNCPELAGDKGDLPDAITMEFQTLDLVEALLDGTFADHLPHAERDLAVAFGLMHHLPTFALRTRTLEGLVDSLRPGGLAIVSFWQFLNDPRLAAKAAATTAEGRAALDLPAFRENDFLLGWQHAQGIYRFCHHTPEQEIDALLSAVHASGSSAAVEREPGAARGSIPPAGGRPAVSALSFRKISFREIARFSADGKQGTLNRYVVLQRS